ncbi:SDR family NAD(P)-dependent oxidoreductase [Glycomyces luteolus]|uniref:SDR family NAD(P)-dependent oxidoreductase n=1 Tax=Glycomyces luteolus TaxID=2670330 RepID=A0A9X3PH26_9ACTN|nr:SDR family NAD(P)-dependent oxidoreductase [Glycomyces luteolus]MDA1358355.1 SDR family NAD(P)-dependent oxidoreductase [Glycomyces luteolus]
MALILITGASTGLGLAAARTLTEEGHAVVVHTRSPDRVPDLAPHGFVHGDLSRMDETLAVAEQADAFGRFDAVIHNAGVYRDPGALQVNTVAPYLLTAAMSKPRRLIYLSSGYHLDGSTDLDAIDFAETRARPGAYEDSKLYETTLAFAVARRWADTVAHVVDPGWVPTRMGGPGAPGDLEEGHRTQEWLAAAPDEAIVPRTGGYWHHGRISRSHPAASDPDFQHELIGRLEAHTGVELG